MFLSITVVSPSSNPQCPAWEASAARSPPGAPAAGSDGQAVASSSQPLSLERRLRGREPPPEAVEVQLAGDGTSAPRAREPPAAFAARRRVGRRFLPSRAALGLAGSREPARAGSADAASSLASRRSRGLSP
mmetsp:Transcript_81205/g.220041  ORF Transcript_81205/g.220041 Transcript_81205/m.220041 type:complete len:132 (+) Transcript_81205:806-1201(+)